jgi:hypothetical protein
MRGVPPLDTWRAASMASRTSRLELRNRTHAVADAIKAGLI